MDILQAGLGIFLAYLVGSISPAYILVRLRKGVDIRSVGSGNVGTLNTYTQLGAPSAIGVLLADGGKGALGYFLPIWFGAPDWTAALGGLAAVAGHNWPVFLKFRGGKGAATIAGIGIAMAPFFALGGIGATVLLLVVTRHMVSSALIGILAYDIAVVAIWQGTTVVVLSLALTALVAITYLRRSFRPMLVAFRKRRWREVVFPR